MKPDLLEDLEIEPLSDEALELVAGGKSSDGETCCSCSCCSNENEDPCPEEIEPST